MLVVGKEVNTLSTLHGIANCVKNGTRKIVPSNRTSRSMQCRPHLLLVKSDHWFFRKENSNLETNVSHFGVLHWQQWQPSASAPYSGLVRKVATSVKSSMFDVWHGSISLQFHKSLKVNRLINIEHQHKSNSVTEVYALFINMDHKHGLYSIFQAWTMK